MRYRYVVRASRAAILCVFLSQGLDASVAQISSAEGPAAVAGIAQLVARGRDLEALDKIKEERIAHPGTPGLDRLEGDALYDLNRLQEAEPAFARAIQANPHDESSAQMDALTLFRLGKPAAAIPLLEVNHTFGSQTKADPTYVLALCYMDTRRYDDARHAFAGQFGFAPDSAAAYLLAARMLLRREYLPVAQSFVSQALQLDPHLPGAHELLGEADLAGNHLDEAIKEFEAERAMAPLEGAVYERLGDAYSRSARYSDASRVLQQAVLLEPNATGPYILLGKVLLKQNETAGAVMFLQKAEAMDSANFITHNLLAQAYRMEGRAEEASRELKLTEEIQAADTPKLVAKP